jgi:cell division protein FtsL
MATAARARSANERDRSRRSSADFRVLNTPIPRDRGLSPVVVRAFKLAIVFAIGLGLIALCRVWLTSASTSVLLTSQQTNEQVSSLRSTGENLEVEQSRLSNPSRISASAEALGMVKQDDGAYLSLSDDVIATDSDGDLSVAGSIKATDSSAADEQGLVASGADAFSQE